MWRERERGGGGGGESERGERERETAEVKMRHIPTIPPSPLYFCKTVVWRGGESVTRLDWRVSSERLRSSFWQLVVWGACTLKWSEEISKHFTYPVTSNALTLTPLQTFLTALLPTKVISHMTSTEMQHLKRKYQWNNSWSGELGRVRDEATKVWVD